MGHALMAAERNCCRSSFVPAHGAQRGLQDLHGESTPSNLPTPDLQHCLCVYRAPCYIGIPLKVIVYDDAFPLLSWRLGKIKKYISTNMNVK